MGPRIQGPPLVGRMMALRKSKDQVIGGVCGGLAEEFGADPTLVRVLYAVITIVSALAPGLIIYLILYLVMEEPA